MRYQVVIVGPAVPDTEMVAGTGLMSDVTIIARTDDLELAYLILNWAGDQRRMPHERLGVWDCVTHDWRVPDQVLRGG